MDDGIALVRGLSNFDKTRAHATAFKALNDELSVELHERAIRRSTPSRSRIGPRP